MLTLVDVRGIGFLPGLGALLLLTGGSSRLLAGFLLLSGCFAAGWGLATGCWSLLCLWSHS